MLQKWCITGILFIGFYTVSGTAEGQSKPPQYGQITVPVFRSKDDSLRLILVHHSIDEELLKHPPRQRKLDSLIDLERRIYNEAIVFKVIYKPSKNFILTDSLMSVRDFAEIKYVTVSGKSIIPDEVFKCINIEALELINTSIEELPKELNTLPSLKTVNIYNNHSKKSLRLRKNEVINFMDIKTENPKTLPRSFKKIRGLTKLDLSENKLTRFPNGTRHNKKLKELSLQRNLLTLKSKIKKNPYLEQLALHNNKIEVVPATIRNLKNIKKLNFNSNQITYVHKNIGELKKLEQLSFYNNRLTGIPQGVYNLKSLKEIDLFHNEIEEIESGFCQWSNLVTLYLSHNKLVALPSNIDTLRMLEGLYLWDNRLGTLPASLGKINGLKYLRVNNNYLKDLPSSVFELTKLEELDISHNYITSVPETIFAYPKIKILAMVNNPWDEKTLQFLSKKADELKQRGAFVHLSDDDN